jgi:hypothetical protein
VSCSGEPERELEGQKNCTGGGDREAGGERESVCVCLCIDAGRYKISALASYIRVQDLFIDKGEGGGGGRRSQTIFLGVTGP